MKLGSVAGPVIQANGRLSFEDDLRSVFHSESASALSLLTVWSLWGNQRMARLQKEQFELLDTSSSSKHSWRAAVGLAGE